jgi:hypothetical protein
MSARSLGVAVLAAALCQSSVVPAVAAPPAYESVDASVQGSEASSERVGFTVVRKLRRGKAQLCRYTLNRYRYVFTRGNSRKSRTTLSYRVRKATWDGVENDWDPDYPARKRIRVKAHHARHVDVTGGPQRPRVRVQIRSRHGATTWSRGKTYADVKSCPDWYVDRVWG